jgi:hypothetical protein
MNKRLGSSSSMKLTSLLSASLAIALVAPLLHSADAPSTITTNTAAETETLYGVTTPALRSRAEVEAVLASAPKPLTEGTLRPLTILIAGGVKDHLPKTHSHDLLPRRWKVLLGGKGPDDEPKVNMYRPEVEKDRERMLAGAPQVKVLTTMDWPTEEQFAVSDIIFLYQSPACWMGFGRVRQVAAFVERGGGLVLSHYVLWRDDADLMNVFGLAMQKGRSQYKHKEAILKFPEPRHPIVLGLPDTIVMADEVYWNFRGDRSKVTPLATSEEMVGDQSRPEPVIWTYERGKGRVVASTLGHFDWTFDDPYFRMILLRGMAWAAGESPYRFDPLVLRGIPMKD